MGIVLKQLSVEEIETIKTFFADVFMKEPWNDDWSDKEQLHAYMMDLIGNPNSLALGLYEEKQLVGLSMGSIMHWYSGTQYYIVELCIKTTEQGRGLGTIFIKEIEKFIKERGISCIFLQTERTVPAYEFYKKNGFFDLDDHVSLVKNISN